MMVKIIDYGDICIHIQLTDMEITVQVIHLVITSSRTKYKYKIQMELGTVKFLMNRQLSIGHGTVWV
jgi:hypothetical protein